MHSSELVHPCNLNIWSHINITYTLRILVPTNGIQAPSTTSIVIDEQTQLVKLHFRRKWNIPLDVFMGNTKPQLSMPSIQTTNKHTEDYQLSKHVQLNIKVLHPLDFAVGMITMLR